MRVDPMQIIQMIKGGNNPQQLVLNFLNQNSMQNPMLANLAELAKSKDVSSLENLARNAARERGLDFDKEFEKFKRTYNL